MFLFYRNEAFNPCEISKEGQKEFNVKTIQVENQKKKLKGSKERKKEEIVRNQEPAGNLAKAGARL